MNNPKPFPKGDVRRYFTLLSAINRLGKNATLRQLVKETGHNRGTIAVDIGKMQAQLCVEIVKEGLCYRIKSLGPLLTKQGIEKCLKR
jgi:ABC-type branched-subunit amino acid transport system ATPase component